MVMVIDTVKEPVSPADAATGTLPTDAAITASKTPPASTDKHNKPASLEDRFNDASRNGTLSEALKNLNLATSGASRTASEAGAAIAAASPASDSAECVLTLSIGLQLLQTSVSEMSNELIAQRGLQGHLAALLTQASKEIYQLRSQLAQVEEERNKFSSRVKTLEDWLGSTNAIVLDPSKTNQVMPESEVSPTPTQSQIKPPPVNKKVATENGRIPNHVDLFIGNLESHYNCRLVQSHINDNTEATVGLSDINKLNVQSETKAFKVRVPEENKWHVLSAWHRTVKAEVYKPRPKTTSGNHAKNGKPGYNDQRNNFQKGKGYRPRQKFNRPAYNYGQKEQNPRNRERSHYNFPKQRSQRKPYQPNRWAPNRREEYQYQYQQDSSRRDYNHCQQYSEPNAYNGHSERHENRYYEPYPDDQYYQNTYRY